MAPMFGVSKKARVGLICILLPIVLMTENTRTPLGAMHEAPSSAPLSAPGGHYDPVQLGASEDDGATVTLRYAFNELPGVDRAAARPVALDTYSKRWIREQFARRRPLWFLVCHGFVRLFAYKWVAGALFNYPELYLLSPTHWKDLLYPFLVRKDEAPLCALDVGAGTGSITSGYASLFDKVVATEVSRPYVWRLQQRGFDAYKTEVVNPANIGGQADFDVVFALNVLDRHAHPFRLLSEIAQVLRPGGAVVLSVPLPVTQHDAGQYLPMLHASPEPLGLKVGLTAQNDRDRGESWEEAASELVTKVIQPQGWRVVSVTRAPYMAAGGRGRTAPIVALDSVVIVVVRAHSTDDVSKHKGRGASHGGKGSAINDKGEL